MAGLRFEAWDIPTSAQFDRKIADIPVIVGTGSGTVQFRDGGRGKLSVPGDYDRLTEIISPTDGSLIRVMDGSTIIHEWLAQRTQVDFFDGGRVVISGPDINSMLSKSIIYPYDYDVQPTLDADWYWGDSEHNLMFNGDFEDGTNMVGNEGFETGAVAPWYAGAVDGFSATLAISSLNADVGSFHARCTPLLSEGGMSTRLAGFYPEKTYTVTARVDGTSGKTIQVGVTGPETMGVGTADRILAFTGAFEGTFEVQKDDAADGTYRTVSFTFDTAPEQTSGQLSVRDASGTPGVFDVDDVTVTGYGVGMGGWMPTDTTLVTTFEASTDVSSMGVGSYVGKVTAGDGSGIFQDITAVSNGVTYTVSVFVRNTSGSARWVLDVADEFGQRIGQDDIVTTTVFQKLEITGIVPTDLPGNRTMVVTLRNVSGGSATVYVDAGQVYRGQPSAFVGDIVGQLKADATVDHVSDVRGASLDWLDDSGFSTTLDTDGTSWTLFEAFIARHGEPFLNVMRNMVKLGYEWRITPKATVALPLTHDLEFYEPLGMGTDYTSAATPSVVFGAGTHGASVIRRIPEFTSAFVAGNDGAYAETQDGTLVTNFGLWETFDTLDTSSSAVGLSTYVSDLIDEQEFTATSAQVRMIASELHPRPFIDFNVGDQMVWQIPPHLPKEDRRVTRITYKNSEPSEYTVEAIGYDPGK